MKKTFTLIALLFCCLELNAQTLPPVDLSFELADPPPSGTQHYTIPFGDSIPVYFKITNQGTGDLDTSDYVFYSIDLVPAGMAFVATDSSTGTKAYLEPGDYFIDRGILFTNTDSSLAEDFTDELCFYLLHDFSDSLFYSDTNALNDTLCFSVTYLKNPDATSIAGNNSGTDRIDLYPNPAVKDLRIDFSRPLNKTHTFIVTNMMGREVYRADIAAGRSAFSYDVSALPAGMYTVQISGADINVIKKWIRQ